MWFAVGYVVSALAAEPKPGSRVPAPAVKIEKGEQCVAPTDEMRRNHMNMILHQRDRTVHEGIRSVKHSLKNCINCHASPKTNSVLGKDGFCESCHAYASVKLDCFECHSPSPQKVNPLSPTLSPQWRGGVNPLSRSRERGSLGNTP